VRKFLSNTQKEGGVTEMKKLCKMLVRILSAYGKCSSRLPSYHGNGEPVVPDSLKR